MILQNEAQCRKCNDIIWSAHRHDFKTCKCGAISVDGGMDYIRRVGNPEDIIDRSLTTDKETFTSTVNWISEQNKTGADAEAFSDIVFHEYGNKTINNPDMEPLIKAAQWGIDTGRNTLGIVLAVIRAMRDNGVLNMEKFNND